jgi:glycolate oxidase iron-sulfur subunit
MDDLRKKVQREAEKCILCGSCHAVCPVYAERLDEAEVARGRMALLQAVLSGELELTDRLNEILSTCIGCKACADSCPSGAAPDLGNLAAKLVLGKEKGLPFYKKLLTSQVLAKPMLLSASSRVANMVGKKVYTPLSKIAFVRAALPYILDGLPRSLPHMGKVPFHVRHRQNRPEGKPRGRVALFYGCAIDHIYPEWAEYAIGILNRAGFHVDVPEGLTCCGAPVLFTGDAATAGEMMATNLARLTRPDLDAVITLCATCGSSLKELYPEFHKSEDARYLSEKVIDLQEFLTTRNLLGEYERHQTDASPLRVTYHDPCHLSRGMKVREAPREILESLPGIEFVEMQDADRCCGGGGLFSMSHYDLSVKIGRQKVANIIETGAEVVATACPSCVLHLTDLLRREGVLISVVHVCDLIEKSVSGLPAHQTLTGSRL